MGHLLRALLGCHRSRPWRFCTRPKAGQPKLVKAAAQPFKPLLGCQSYSLPTLELRTLAEGEY